MLTLFQALKVYGYVKGERFDYNFTPISGLIPGSDAQETVTIDNDFHFIVENIFADGFLSAASLTPVKFSTQFQDTSTSKFFSTSPINSRAYLSNAEAVAPWPIARLVPKRTSITMRVINDILIPTANIDVHVTLRGYKLYPKGWVMDYLKRSDVANLAKTPLGVQSKNTMNL